MEKQIGAAIKKIRRQKELTLDVLAHRTGLSKGYLSRLERGLKSAPVSTLSNIACALGVEMTDFFQKDETRPKISIVQPDQRMKITRDGSTFGYVYEALAEKYRPKTVEPFLITFTPNVQVPELFSHQGEEMVFILSGRLSFIYGDEVYSCQAGDCLYFDSSVRHRADAVGDEEAKALMLLIPRKGK